MSKKSRILRRAPAGTLPMCALLALSLMVVQFTACTSDDLQSFKDVVAGVAGGIGAAATVAGVSQGNSALASQGANLVGQAADFDSDDSSSAATPQGNDDDDDAAPTQDQSTIALADPTPSAPSASGTGSAPSTGGAGTSSTRAGRQVIANACQSRALSRYSSGNQNVAEQAAACLYYCAYDATHDPQYQKLYIQSQDNANSLCSAGISRTCNEIDTNYCRWNGN